MNCAAVAASQFLNALASAHLVRYFVPMMMYLAPVHFPGGLIGPTKSIAHFSNARSVICGHSGISSLREGFQYPLGDITASAKLLSVFVQSRSP